MRIAYVCADQGIPVWGTKGASVHVQGILGAMVRAGHDVTLLAARLGGRAPEDLRAIRVAPLDLADLAPTSSSGLLQANRTAFDALASLGPFDLVYERYSLWSYGAMEFARQMGVPGVLEVNAPLIDEQSRHRTLPDRANAERVACRVFGAASTIVAVSDEVAAYVDAHPCSAHASHVVPNGIDPSRFAAPPWRRDVERVFTLGFLGTLKPWHGLQTLVNTFARVRDTVPNARLTVVGDGPERAAMLAQLEHLGLAHDTVFAGAVEPRDVPRWLSDMDVALAPYPADAPFYFSPLKVVEYMAAGLPVVASDLGQIPTLVEDGVTGVLVPPGDTERFAAACIRISRDREWARQLGDNARRVALRDRTWDGTLRRILALTPCSTHELAMSTPAEAAL